MIGVSLISASGGKCVDCGQRINDMQAATLDGLRENGKPYYVLMFHQHCLREAMEEMARVLR